MKKIWAVFAAGALSVLLGAAAYAEGYEYLFMLDDGRVTLTIPDRFEYYALPDSSPSEPIFSELKLDYDDVMDYMEKGHCYFYAFVPDDHVEFSVQLAEADVQSYDDFDEDQLKSDFEDTVFDLSDSVYDYGFKTINGVKYAYCKYKQTDPASPSYTMMYVTLQNYTYVNYYMRSYQDDFTPEEEAALQDILLKASYNEYPIANQSSFCTDPVTGISFRVPAGWYKDQSVERDTMLYAVGYQTFSPSYFLYFNQDASFLFSKDPPREDASEVPPISDYFSAQDVADIYQTDESDVRLEYIRSKEFYVTHIQSGPLSDTGHDMEVWLTNDGSSSVYSFVFTGTLGSEDYEDFQSILSSCSIVPEEPVPSATAENSPRSGTIFLCFVGIFCVGAAIIFLYKMIERKKSSAS